VGLAGLLFFSLSATTLRATGDEWRSPPWNAARPLDGIDLAIEEELPSTLQVRLEEGVLSIPGHVVTLRRLGAGEAASGASPAADDIVLCIPPSALIPDAHGVMEVDLSALPLKPHTHYALTWEQRDLQAAPRANVRLLRPLARGELVTSFLRHARERLFGSGFGTIAWLLGLAVLLLGGAGLLMHDGRDVDGSSLRI
jgi:hypothetical protein